MSSNGHYKCGEFIIGMPELVHKRGCIFLLVGREFVRCMDKHGVVYNMNRTDFDERLCPGQAFFHIRRLEMGEDDWAVCHAGVTNMTVKVYPSRDDDCEPVTVTKSYMQMHAFMMRSDSGKPLVEPVENQTTGGHFME